MIDHFTHRRILPESVKPPYCDGQVWIVEFREDDGKQIVRNKSRFQDEAQAMKAYHAYRVDLKPLDKLAVNELAMNDIFEKITEIFAHNEWALDKSDIQEFLAWLLEHFEVTCVSEDLQFPASQEIADIILLTFDKEGPIIQDDVQEMTQWLTDNFCINRRS